MIENVDFIRREILYKYNEENGSSDSEKDDIYDDNNTIIESKTDINFYFDLNKIFNDLNYQKSKTGPEFLGDLSTKNYNNIITSNIGAEKFIIPIIKYLKNKHKKIVLVADDNEIIRNSIKKLIKNLYKDKNIKTITLSDGIEILYLIMIDQILHNNIKIIISDEQMTFLNGTEYIKY